MAPLLLRCAIVGQRSVFTMQVDGEWSVGSLLITISKTRRLNFPGFLMDAYIAHPIGDSRSAWLKTSDPDYDALMQGGDARMKELFLPGDRKMYGLDQLKVYFPNQPDEHAIHVLLEFPSYESLVKYWTVVKTPSRIAAIAKSDHPSEVTAEPLYEKIVGPLRDSVSSLAAWIDPTRPTDAGKTKAA